MPISELKKQSDLEKRLKLLRQQVYGKNLTVSNTPTHRYTDPPIYPLRETSRSTDTLSSDISYLYKDLAKIFILAAVALIVQFTLFFLMQKNLINLNF